MIVSGADKVWLSFWFYEITTIPDEKIKKNTSSENTSSYTENTS